MRVTALAFAILGVLIASTGTAEAAPVFGAVAKLVSLLGATSMGALSIGGGAFGAAIARIATGLASSALSRMFRKEPGPRGVMRRIDLGANRPQRVLLGHYATAGHLIWAGSHGAVGKTPNAYFTNVVQLSALPIDGIDGIIVNGARATLGATAHADFGFPVTQFRIGSKDHLWVRVYDGSQTTADPMLLAKYAPGAGSMADMPWLPDMIGRGVAYAIITTLGNDQLFGGQVPEVIFETRGLKLYDRRLDGTRGGVGLQRLTDRSTWAFSANPIVAAETLLTAGFGFGSEHLYGPRWPAYALPAATWLAAINACDVSVLDQNGDPQPSYRFGCDLDLAAEPRETLRELLKCAAADFAPCEGRALVHVGAAGAPAAHFEDVDCSVQHEQELDAFRGLEELFNAASATFPDPLQGWAMVPAPTPANPGWEAEDGGRRSADMPFAWVPWVDQVQRLVASALKEQRRQRVHRLVLRPRFGFLAPLDFVTWTSLRNGYSAKLFKITAVRDLRTGHVEVLLIEQDPDDYDPPVLVEHAPAEPVIPEPTARQIGAGDWALTAGAVQDAGGIDRRPSLVVTWQADTLEDVQTLDYEVQVAATEEPVTAGTTGVDLGALTISDGITDAVEYRVRLYPQAPGAEWSDWKTVTTDEITRRSAPLDGEYLVAAVDAWETAIEVLTGPVTLRDVWRVVGGLDYREQSAPFTSGGWSYIVTWRGQVQLTYALQKNDGDAFTADLSFAESALAVGSGWTAYFGAIDLGGRYHNARYRLRTRVTRGITKGDPLDPDPAPADIPATPACHRDLFLTASRTTN